MNIIYKMENQDDICNVCGKKLKYYKRYSSNDYLKNNFPDMVEVKIVPTHGRCERLVHKVEKTNLAMEKVRFALLDVEFQLFKLRNS